MQNGKLLGPYVELVGHSGIHSFDLILPYLSTPDSFIGVDRSSQVIAEHRKNEPPFGTIYSKSVINTAQLKTPIFLNYDGYGAANSIKWWGSESFGILDVIKKSVQKYGAFGFILNKVLGVRGNINKTAHGFHDGLTNLVSRFNVSISPTLEKIDGTGSFGSYDVYQGESVRMITYRTVFTRLDP